MLVYETAKKRKDKKTLNTNVKHIEFKGTNLNWDRVMSKKKEKEKETTGKIR